jgi:hypothetical protein
MAKNPFLALAVVVVLTGIAIVLYSAAKDAGSTEETNASASMRADDVALTVDVADTMTKRARGLSGRANVPENGGMLFLFDSADTHGIWMKDMRFSIDIIWLDSDLRIVDIKKEASPYSYPEVFTPREPAFYVLEVASGLSDRVDLQIGDQLILE